MKKKIGLFLVLVAVSVSLIACSETSVEAGIPSGFEAIAKDPIDGSKWDSILTVRHEKTGCFYTIAVKSGTGGGVDMEQMFIEKNNMNKCLKYYSSFSAVSGFG